MSSPLVMPVGATPQNFVAIPRELVPESLQRHIVELGPTHPDIQNEWNAHIHGLWRIRRFNAPVEWYAGKILGVTEEDVPAFQQLPAAVQFEAMRKLEQQHAVDESDFEETFANVFLIAGVQALWQQAAGNGTTNSGAAAAGANAYFNNAQAMIGVGDSTTAAANSQTDLNLGVHD